MSVSSSGNFTRISMTDIFSSNLGLASSCSYDEAMPYSLGSTINYRSKGLTKTLFLHTKVADELGHFLR